MGLPTRRRRRAQRQPLLSQQMPANPILSERALASYSSAASPSGACIEDQEMTPAVFWAHRLESLPSMCTPSAGSRSDVCRESKGIENDEMDEVVREASDFSPA